MLQTTGDLWDQIGKACAICITTNGFAKRNGEAVMGRGCAAQAKKRYLGIERNLGRTLIRRGNFPSQIWKDDTTSIISFPVKGESKKILQASDLESIVKHKRNDFKINDTVPGWALKAEPEIIEQSAQHLVLIADIGGLNNIYLPRPGCGWGELEWKTIYPILNNILDDRFTVITYKRRSFLRQHIRSYNE